MAIGLTDEVAPLGTFPIARDTNILGGYRAVADLTARDAISTERRSEGMRVRVNSNGLDYVLGSGLTNGDWTVASVSASALDVYLSSSGDDANDGLTVGTPVATWARAWAVAGIASPAIIHLTGDVTGYVAPPSALTWVIITGDDNFTVVATGAAGAGTTANVVELAVAATTDEYRHYTIEFTSGAAAGYRRTIRDNTTTIVTPVQAFETHDAAVVPVPGDTYRILRPSARITGAAVVNSSTYRQLALGTTGRVDLVNVQITGSNGHPTLGRFYNYIVPAPFGVWYGVEVFDEWLIDANSGVIYAGADDIDTAALNQGVIDALGIGGYVHGQWVGWGLSFEIAPFNGTAQSRIGIRSQQGAWGNPRGFFYGWITAGEVFATNWYIRGGSARTLWVDSHGSCGIQINNTPSNFSIPANTLLLRGDTGSRINSVETGQIYIQRTRATENRAITMETTGSTPSSQINISAGCNFVFESAFDISYSGGSPAKVLNVQRGASFDYRPVLSAGQSSVWNMGTGGVLAAVAEGAKCGLSALIATVSAGITNNGGRVSLFQTSSAEMQINSDTYVLIQTDGETTTNNTVTCTGDAAETIAIQGGTMRQIGGTFSCTNAATGANDALRVNAGAQTTISGGASTVLTATAGASGFGINARGGGRVYTVAQPSSVAGTTADLTVGTGGGEDQPDTALSASLSSLVSADTLSSIARTT